MYACRLHSELRVNRLKKEGWKWRDGEKRLDDFWNGGEHPCNGSKKCRVDNEGRVKGREKPRSKHGYHPKELKEE